MRHEGESPDASACDAARHAVLIFAVDPSLGLRLKAPASPVRDAWLASLRSLLPAATPWRRMPAGCPPARLGGGTHFAASLASGRMVAERGLLGEAAGGVLLLASAERVERGTAALLARAVDPAVPAEGARVGLLALDEGADAEAPPPGLLERLAIHLDLTACRADTFGATRQAARRVATARVRLAQVTIPAAAIEALCTAALAFGIASLSVPRDAVRIAKIAAALAGRRRVAAADVALAARLCLGPRACVVPAAEAAPERDDAACEPRLTDGHEPRTEASQTERQGGASLEQVVVSAARSSIPDALLRRNPGGSPRRVSAEAAGRGLPASAATRGRPFGSRPGRPQTAADVDLAATLQAAIPWQMLRGRPPGGALRLRSEDLRVVRRRAPRRATTVFAVDASGSAAHGRLAEAKGAIELLLAECYVRRDEVALVAFRGPGAALLLPPTRSLARAKRELADLPGGGGTPLAAGLDLALAIASQARQRDGRDVLIAVLTDGRGNVGRDGAADRARAEADSMAAATAIRAAGLPALVIDVSPRPNSAAARLADTMAARYLPLPHAAAATIVAAVQPAMRGAS